MTVMSLFANAEQHAEHPPSSWRAVKQGGRWALVTTDRTQLDTFRTKMAAEDGKVSGFCARLYVQESRWYAGEEVGTWKAYAGDPVKATRDLVEGDRVQVGSGVVRTVASVEENGAENGKGEPLVTVWYGEGRTPEWGPGNSCRWSAVWKLAR